MARPRLAFRVNMQRKENVGYSFEGSNLERRLALGNRVRAALDGAENLPCLRACLFGRQPSMLAYASAAGAAILSILGDVALAAVAEGAAAEAANCVPMAAVPKHFAVFPPDSDRAHHKIKG